MGEHRASVLSASLRRYEDPARSRDPRIRRIVAELTTLEPAPAPRAHFRAELRSQLVAVAPRLVAEGVSAERPAVPATAPARNRRAAVLARAAAAADRASSVKIGRPVAIITAVVAVFAVLLGGSVWMSKKSLPGDPLYALKRANEDVQLSLTTSDTARGEKYLDFAATRVSEVNALLKRADASALGSGATAAAGISPHTAKLVTDTLNDADADVRNAAQVLGREAVDGKSSQPLQILLNWAPGQLTQMQAVASRIPAGSLHDRADGSAQLLSDAMGRASVLQGLVGCSCLGSSGTDELGPVPCTVCASAPTPLPPLQTVIPLPGLSSGQSTQPGSSTSAGGASTSGGVSTSTSGGVPAVTTGGGSSSSGGGPVKVPPLPTISVPSLPVPTPTHSPTCVVNLIGICVKI